MRRPHNTSLAGNSRTTNLVGVPFGPYVVERYVGDDWRKSVYAVLKCPLCGYKLSHMVQVLSAKKRTKSCTKCRGKAVTT